MAMMMLIQHIDAPFIGAAGLTSGPRDVDRGHTAPIFRELKR
jgi:hypothetical protein